jgi:hypothetical protein
MGGQLLIGPAIKHPMRPRGLSGKPRIPPSTEFPMARIRLDINPAFSKNKAMQDNLNQI